MFPNLILIETQTRMPDGIFCVVHLGAELYCCILVISGVNYCENSTCSHLCLLKPQGFSCQCPVGMQLMKDNRTCEGNTFKILTAIDQDERWIELKRQHMFTSRRMQRCR